MAWKASRMGGDLRQRRCHAHWSLGFRGPATAWLSIYDRQHKLALEDYDYEDHNWHARDFLDCIRSRKAPNAEIAIGHTSTLHAHLANIVVRTGQPLKFDANLETVFGSESAQEFLGRNP